jgi:hypothetical protein
MIVILLSFIVAVLLLFLGLVYGSEKILPHANVKTTPASECLDKCLKPVRELKIRIRKR